MPEPSEDENQLPAIRRTPGGTYAPGHSGNVRGRPKGARGLFSEQMVSDFARDWRTSNNGPDTIARVRAENPGMYLSVAVKLVPRELLLSLERPLTEMSDDELRAAALTERDANAMIIEKVCELGGAELVEAAERAVRDDIDAYG